MYFLIGTTWYHFYLIEIYTIQERFYQTENIFQKNYGNAEYDYKTSRK